ncbi:tetratricopeptide repeat domain-containing protein [Fusarium austroafricanum]|uniref:Tetratricopeptide repeat domain-containing protein n=1 Tax=Fusarium austroafricanum TaxID=2364996 RepID=A0A8H4KX06_9HYPO|nr:tetratricopeptide repeat domain-containing protein [Fusarium austroafricanum]
MLAEIIHRCAWYLLENHQFADGKGLAKDAISICKEARKSQCVLGFTQDRYIPRLLADLYRVVGSLECESHAKGHGLAWAMKARSIRQELYLTTRLEKDRKVLQGDQNNVAVDIMADGRPQDALPLLQDVYAYDVASGGITTVNFYRTMNLSICYRLLGRLSEAMKYSSIAMKVIQDHIGDDGIPMAAAQFSLGSLLLCMDDRVGAFEAFCKCYRIRHKLIPSHHDTAFAAHKLGAMAAQNGDLNVAITFLTQALRIFGGTNTPSLAATRTAYLLSVALLDDGQVEAAVHLKAKVDKALESSGERANVDRAEYSEAFFDSFVLFRHL